MMYLKTRKTCQLSLLPFLILICIIFYYQEQLLTFRVQLPKLLSITPLNTKYDDYHQNWIVITSIQYPSKDIQRLTRLKGWKVLVVGDLKTPSNWTYPGCTFLSVEEQKLLGYKTADLLPYNSYTRKNIGYLYAIQHGARYIYDTDDDNHPIDDELNFYSDDTMTGLIYDGAPTPYFNPYAHFGQPSIWPRGYPLEVVTKSMNNKYRLCTFKTPAIQQGLVNGDPDVDAIYRLLKKPNDQKHINISFNKHAPPVILPARKFAPFNSQNTFFTYEALWSLYLPSSVAFRVTDIWRGYWAQRLLWLLGQKLAFLPPNAFQLRNSHDYLKDFKDEEDVYLKTKKLIQFLNEWTCQNQPGQNISFFQCVRHLSEAMASEGFWDVSDAKCISMWLSDLVAIGYKEPEIAIDLSDNGCINNDDIRTVYYSPVSPSLMEIDIMKSISTSYTLCSKHLNNSIWEESGLPYPSYVFNNLLLVIVFNFPHYSIIKLLKAVYKDHFPNIIFCGQTTTHEKLMMGINQQNLTNEPEGDVSFINITSARGLFGYECAIRAMQMNYNVNGYLIAGDDVLLKYWNLKDIIGDRPLLTSPSYRTISRYLDPTKLGWGWWGAEVGKNVTNEALTLLEEIASEDINDSRHDLIRTYLDNRDFNLTVVSISLADFYYIPRSVSNIFVEVMKVFYNHKVFQEIAVPTTISGLHPGNIHSGFQGISLWGDDRRHVFTKYYNTSNHYIHPLKLSTVLSNPAIRKQYCKNYVRDLIQKW